MRYEVEVGGRLRQVVVARVGDAFAVTVDGRTWGVDAARVDAHTLSLILDRVWLNDTGSSREVVVVAEPTTARLTVGIGTTPVPVVLNGRLRSGRRDESVTSASGPRRIVAPMPGKVARVLVQIGEVVHARQPVVVVEAMKMENELRAGRDGTVAEIHAREGALVDAGALLVVIQ